MIWLAPPQEVCLASETRQLNPIQKYTLTSGRHKFGLPEIELAAG